MITQRVTNISGVHLNRAHSLGSYLGLLGCFFVGFCVLLGAGATASSGAPNCVAGPALEHSNSVIVGTECSDRIVVTAPGVVKVFGGGGDDVIFANSNVVEVRGGSGDDRLYGEPPTPGIDMERIMRDLDQRPQGPVYEVSETDEEATSKGREGGATASIALGDESQKFHGGPGEDWIFGQRGNDTIWGHNENDLIYGGPGDDFLYGEHGDDILGGGFGYDELDGGDGSDMSRGDATIDQIADNGSYGVDTLSFASATTPGFSGGTSFANFPPEGGERGVYVRLDGIPACNGENPLHACNNTPKYGGGNDEIVTWQFENVIGSPFADIIVGNAWNNRIDGGGGADVIYGSAGDDLLYGGADGDFLQGEGGSDVADGQSGFNNCWSDAEVKVSCHGSAMAVTPRDPGKISVGFQATSMSPYTHSVQMYVVGSNTHDSIYGWEWIDSATSQVYVTFKTLPDTWAYFDTSAAAYTPGCDYIKEMVNCRVPATVDSLLMAGMDHDDQININEGKFFESVSPVLLGGPGGDAILGSGSTEDVLVDGAGTDWATAFGWDDVLVNDTGNDTLEGGNGNDLLLSTEICGGDILHGGRAAQSDGSAQNNASWAQLPAPWHVVASLEAGRAGENNSAGPQCSFGNVSSLYEIDDLEGTSQNDILTGNGQPNGIMGRNGNDFLYGRAGDDHLQAANPGLPEGTDQVRGEGGNADRCDVDGSDTFLTCEKLG